MPRKRLKPKPECELTLLAVRLDRGDARVGADINYDAKDPRYALTIDDEDPVYHYVTQLKVSGTSTYPEDRAGDRYDITITGDESHSRHVSPKLRDLQQRDEHGSRVYRPYRGGEIPVYRRPRGFGLLDKIRGEAAWTGWVNVEARLVSDMLVLLMSGRPLFLAVEERKEGRTRWIDGITLQTTDPAGE